jgi:hypothetical protein
MDVTRQMHHIVELSKFDTACQWADLHCWLSVTQSMNLMQSMQKTFVVRCGPALANVADVLAVFILAVAVLLSDLLIAASPQLVS